MKSSIAFIILTWNEEKNLGACLKSIKPLANEIFVVDSFSTDNTINIAKSYGANVIQHEFKNQAQQFNWALDTLDIESDWIFRIDADEYLTSELQNELRDILPSTPPSINGYFMKRRVYFMGRFIKHGGYYPIWFLRLFRRGEGRSEERKMDEHITLFKGKTSNLNHDFVDDNKRGMAEWIRKHKNYASREAEEVLQGRVGEGKRRAMYYRFPIFLRVILYFFYRYFIKLGFLDGKEGLVFHMLHGFWYRFLVDLKILKATLRKIFA